MTIASIGITTEAANAIAAIISAKALGHFKANTVLANLVARDWEPEVAKQGESVTVFKRGTLSSNAKSEHTIVTLQAPSPSYATITLNRHREVTFLVEDMVKAMAAPDLLDGYMQDAMRVLAEDVDGYIAGLYSGLSQTIDASSTNGPLADEDIVEAQRLLNAAHAPVVDRYAALHEDAWAEFQMIEGVINRQYSQRPDGLPASLAASWMASYRGFQFYMDQNMTVATTCKSILAQKYALGLATRPMPAAPAGMGVTQVVMDEDGVGLRVTLSYNPDYLGMQCTVDMLYGASELIDGFGVALSTSEA